MGFSHQSKKLKALANSLQEVYYERNSDDVDLRDLVYRIENASEASTLFAKLSAIPIELINRSIGELNAMDTEVGKMLRRAQARKINALSGRSFTNL